MKKILLYMSISIAAILFTACDKDEHPTENGLNPNGPFTFNLSLEVPDEEKSDGVVAKAGTRAAVTMSRYLLEMYEGNLTATPVKMNNTTGTFDVTMKKGVDYICLFWADGGEKEYTATNLKAVTQITPANVGKPAYYGKVTVNTSNFNGAVTLKRAVAEVNFTETTGFTTADNTLTVKYPITGAAFNVSDGTVANFGTGAEITRNFTGIVATAKDGILATDYLLAPAMKTAMNGIKIKFNEYDEQTLTATPLQANFKTNINGKYDTPLPPAKMTFTIDLTSQTDKTYVLPFAETGSTGNYTLTIDWGDGSAATTIPAGTDLSTPAAATLLTHNTYAQQKTYQITVTSSQGDGSKPQMPGFKPGKYRISGDNSLKISLMDSPMLNMGERSFRDAFRECTNLKTIHADLFANNTAVTNFGYCFSDCSSLTTIPEGLFVNNTAVTTFEGCFYKCSSITFIPEGLFAKNTAVTDFRYCFYGSSSLPTIPKGLFSANTAVTSFWSCFYGCTSITAIPESLFSTNTAVTSFYGCFYGCTSITSIPESLFSTNTAVTSFYGCFYGCTSITSIPESLFVNNIVVTNFGSCFYECSSLTAIPESLFSKHIAVTNFSYCFYNCLSLASIPEGLFVNNTAVKDFNGCFRDCKSITKIPERLFATNTAVTDFGSCFSGCKALTDIPERLFSTNISVTSFDHCFSSCKALTDIPKGVFAKNTGVTTFESCFYGCTSITAIPEGLFATNTAVTNFRICFRRCESLSTIPEGLFNNNTAATNFLMCFCECYNLKLNDKIFSTTGDKNRFSGKVMDFTDCFNGVGSHLRNVSDSKAPDLWNYSGASTWIKARCFSNCEVSNSGDIPADWKQ